jgi:cell division protein FtsL
MLLLFIGVLVSAIGVSYSAHWNRQLLNTLYNELSVRDKAQAEWGRLILEQSTWTAHSRIEVLATEQLKMHIPARPKCRWWRHDETRRRTLSLALPRGAGFAGVMVARSAGASSTCKWSTVTSSKARATPAACVIFRFRRTAA